MKKSVKRILAMLICIAAIQLSGCNAKDIQDVSSSDAAQSETEPEVFRYGDKALDTLYQFSTDKPEVLASTVSAFPSILEKCHINTDDPIEIFDLLCFDEHGREYQVALLEELDAMFLSSDFSFEYHEWSCQATYLTRRILDPDAKMTPANIKLVWNDGYFQDRWVITLTNKTNDDTEEVGYFDMDNGFARCYESTNP